MLTLWGRINSTNVQKPLICLEELGVPFERHDAGMAFGVVKSPEYLAMNPNGRIPTLQDGDFVLWESNAIVRYLAAKYGVGTLHPANLEAYADADRWMDWQQTTFVDPLTVMFLGTVRAVGAKTEAELHDARVKLIGCMEILDSLLSARSFIGGATFGTADCVISPCVHRLLNLPDEGLKASFGRFTHLNRYYASVMQRPSVQKYFTLPLT